MADKKVKGMKNQVSTWNMFENFDNHGMSDIRAGKLFDTLCCLGFINHWARSDVGRERECIVG